MYYKFSLFYNLFAICNINSLLWNSFQLAALQVEQCVLLSVDFLFVDTRSTVGHQSNVNLLVDSFCVGVVKQDVGFIALPAFHLVFTDFRCGGNPHFVCVLMHRSLSLFL